MLCDLQFARVPSGTCERSALCAEWTSCKPSVEPLAALVEVLRTNKADDGTIGYPGRDYPRGAIDARGVFGGDEELGGRPKQPIALAAEPLVNAPPAVDPDQTAAWLKELWEGELVLVTAQGKEVRRRRGQVQGWGNPLF